MELIRENKVKYTERKTQTHRALLSTANDWLPVGPTALTATGITEIEKDIAANTTTTMDKNYKDQKPTKEGHLMRIMAWLKRSHFSMQPTYLYHTFDVLHGLFDDVQLPHTCV